MKKNRFLLIFGLISLLGISSCGIDDISSQSTSSSSISSTNSIESNSSSSTSDISNTTNSGSSSNSSSNSSTKYYTLNYFYNSNYGYVEGTKPGNYDKNTEITLKAIPFESYTFAGFYRGNVELTLEQTYSFSLIESVDIEVRFLSDTYLDDNYAVTINYNRDFGDVDFYVDDEKIEKGQYDSTYFSNSNLRLVAKPDEGYKFLGFYFNGKLKTTDLDYSFKLFNDYNIDCVFEFDEDYQTPEKGEGDYCSLRYKFDQRYGKVYGYINYYDGTDTIDLREGDFLYGGEIQMYVYTIYGYKFVGFYERNKLLTTEEYYIFKLTRDRDIEVRFVVE